MDEIDSCPSPSSSSSSLTSAKSPLTEEVTRRHDGARKRKLSNPVRLPSVPDDSNDDFCCYDDGTEVVPHDDADPEDQDQKEREEGEGETDELKETIEDEEEDEELDEKNHLERLESLPIFSNHAADDDDHHSDGSAGSNDDCSAAGSPNSTTGSDSIPIDKENPRRCIACGKEFQNHFGVKTQ